MSSGGTENIHFGGMSEVRIRAILAGERFELRSLDLGPQWGASPTILAAGSEGCAVLFRYGAVVLFHVNPREETEFLEALKPYTIGRYSTPETEDAVLCIDSAARSEGAANGRVTVTETSVERLQATADIFAKSVALAHYERSIASAFDRIESLVENLERHGRFRTTSRELVKRLGKTLRIQQRMVGRVAVLEKPDLLWERPDLDRFFSRLSGEYELRDRQAALDRKLQLISRTAETILSLLQQRHSLRVEWYIVILIVVEIILTIILETLRSH